MIACAPAVVNIGPDGIAKIGSAIKSFPDANREASPFANVVAVVVAAVTVSLLIVSSTVEEELASRVVQVEDDSINEIESYSRRTSSTSGVLVVCCAT